jgi:hypothetical protein
VVQFESRSLRGPLQALGLSGAREVADHQAVAMSAPDEDLGNLGDSREHVESVRQWKFQPSFHRSGMPPIRQRDTPPSAARRYLRPLLPGSGVRSPAHAQALCACPRVCAALVRAYERSAHMHMCVRVCVCVCISMYACLHIYVCTHTHTLSFYIGPKFYRVKWKQMQTKRMVPPRVEEGVLTHATHARPAA